MIRIALIACSSAKAPAAEVAHRFYRGTLFRKSVAFAERTCDEWAVLSAKYGLVGPDERLEPYDETLNNKTRTEREQWAAKVLRSIQERWGDAHCTFVFLAGDRYREGLLAGLTERAGVSVEIPMQGLGIGRQLQWLSAQGN